MTALRSGLVVSAWFLVVLTALLFGIEGLT